MNESTATLIAEARSVHAGAWTFAWDCSDCSVGDPCASIRAIDALEAALREAEAEIESLRADLAGA